ncbi:putative baseplate assembly protein [Motilibacter deserti]|uniref:Baseplate assembly protein n=1 Tax=Motilibacter deserti TaxID=2714956 RepID=A0ABX0GW00_9ACTN|nr:putative baseplate assembly protein [Motilibacter deserti]NHC13802.1 putative baseplate assembly protein [Motilibacter deserti]
MALPAPHLDDRDFQSLVDDAKRLVQQRCPEWTDHNVSDPGVTLIETFAYMVDQLLWRLNQVPDRLQVAFLELLGVQLEAPKAAHVPVTFELSAPQPGTVPVPAGTRVATRRGEEEAVVFTTTGLLEIIATRRAYVVTQPAGDSVVQRTGMLDEGLSFDCFAPLPQPGDCLYIGLSDAVPACLVTVRFGCELTAAGVLPEYAPTVWEAWDGATWAECEVISDSTGALNLDGDVVLTVPGSHQSSVGELERLAAWLRCRVVPAENGLRAYERSPRINRVTAFTMGGTVDAVHADVVLNEVVGVSDGVPGQRFPLRHTPVVPGPGPRVVEVDTGRGVQEWQEVASFAASTQDSHHVMVDAVAGELVFGPAVRNPDGSLRCYGGVPPQGSGITIREYLSGGGRKGNIARHAIDVLKDSVPYITSVDNRIAARGGTDPESVDEAKVRGPMVLRTRQRAVTAEDFENLAKQAAPNSVARARCVTAGEAGVAPGSVRVLLVPVAPEGEHGGLEFQDLIPAPDVVAGVQEFLDERRVVGTRVSVERATYVGVTVVATMRSTPAAESTMVSAASLRALYRYLDPLRGGPDGRGWPFGRPVLVHEIAAVLQRVPGVDIVDAVRLFPVDLASQRRAGQVDRLEIGTHELVFSYHHQVRV